MYKVKNNSASPAEEIASSPEAYKSKSPVKNTVQPEQAQDYDDEYDQETTMRKNTEEEDSELLRQAAPDQQQRDKEDKKLKKEKEDKEEAER